MLAEKVVLYIIGKHDLLLKLPVINVTSIIIYFPVPTTNHDFN